jgi:hypothetical protein
MLDGLAEESSAHSTSTSVISFEELYCSESDQELPAVHSRRGSVISIENMLKSTARPVVVNRLKVDFNFKVQSNLSRTRRFVGKASPVSFAEACE